MKKVYLLFITLSIVMFASCKKDENAPTPQQPQQQVTPTPPAPTPTGKETYFAVTLCTQKTTPYDFKQDTTKVRVYHNGTRFYGIYPTYDSYGLVYLSNFTSSQQGHTNDKPIYMNSGDSIVVEFDSLEFSSDATFGFNPKNNNYFKIYTSKKVLDNTLDIWDTLLNSTAEAGDVHLGTAGNSSYPTLIRDWYLPSKKYRFVYRQP